MKEEVDERERERVAERERTRERVIHLLNVFGWFMVPSFSSLGQREKEFTGTQISEMSFSSHFCDICVSHEQSCSAKLQFTYTVMFYSVTNSRCFTIRALLLHDHLAK